MWLIRKISPWQDQTMFFPIGNPALHVFEDKAKAHALKQDLEIKALKNTYLSNHYEYWDVDCTKALIQLDQFISQQYGFHVLVENYSKNEEITNDEVIDAYLPKSLSDLDILKIQNFMGRFHYGIDQVTEFDKYIVLFHPITIGGIANQHEFNYYATKEDAHQSVSPFIHKLFDSFGTIEIVGAIYDFELTEATHRILQSQEEIKFKVADEDYGLKFYSDKKLSEIANGEKILLDLLISVDRPPFTIIKIE